MTKGAMIFRLVLVLTLTMLMALSARAEFSSGSDGSDGVLNPTEDLLIDMADHPDGIYQYTSVNIPQGVTVTFAPNAANAPVVWLVQEQCVIAAGAVVDLSGIEATSIEGGAGGPGGFRGGNGALGAGSSLAECGHGPGGGKTAEDLLGGNGSFGTAGGNSYKQAPSGETYGNAYNLPLLGGSGGGGASGRAGSGGGGAILIAAQRVSLLGSIRSLGAGHYEATGDWTGAGSGGAVRIAAAVLEGNGSINVSGGSAGSYPTRTVAGSGRIRLDAFSDTFTGACSGPTTRGMQSILLLPSAETPSLWLTQVAGISVPLNPSGAASSPDVLLPGEVNNPVTVVVQASNLPVPTPITVEIRPYSAPFVSATALNVGSFASSIATVSLDIPRGGGTIMAKAVTAVSEKEGDEFSYRDIGITTEGETLGTTEVFASLAGKGQVVYVTPSGKRYPLKAN